MGQAMEHALEIESGLRVEELEHGAVWRVRLATPKANILDQKKCHGLRRILDAARARRALKALLIEGEGAHFSFGASVEEHLPQRVAGMISDFHGLLLAMLEIPLATLAIVRGQCLGGGLELALSCGRILASPDARLGQPEIQLGVFAPAASLLLPERLRSAAAEDLLLSGRSLDAEEALRMGLVDCVAVDPFEAALTYLRVHLLPKSASSLRLAVQAARLQRIEDFRVHLQRVERLYLDELMQTSDAVEGLNAFLERRSPQWKNQ